MLEKKFEKRVDKLKAICYNKNVKRVATNAKPIGRKEKTMTNRDFYTAVAQGKMNDDLMQFAQDALTKMDERNAKRNSKPSKTAIENEPIKANIIEYLTANVGLHTANEIGESLGITTQKASSLCGQLAYRGAIVASEVKLPKIGKRRAYRIAENE